LVHDVMLEDIAMVHIMNKYTELTLGCRGVGISRGLGKISKLNTGGLE